MENKINVFLSFLASNQRCHRIKEQYAYHQIKQKPIIILKKIRILMAIDYAPNEVPNSHANKGNPFL